jgi:putative PIN family toxin of toxin-antitoxin system
MRIVLDTSALISAIRSSSGAAAEIVRLALLEELTLLMDYKLVCEYRDVASRSEHIAASRRTSNAVQAVIDALESIATPVLVANMYRPLSQDENDNMVLDVTINGRADVLVTNNVKDFNEAAGRFGIKLQTPRELLMEIRKGNFYHAG